MEVVYNIVCLSRLFLGFKGEENGPDESPNKKESVVSIRSSSKEVKCRQEDQLRDWGVNTKGLRRPGHPDNEDQIRFCLLSLFSEVVMLNIPRTFDNMMYILWDELQTSGNIGPWRDV